MKKYFGKYLTRLVVILTLALFIFPMKAQSLTLDEVCKNDAQLKSLLQQVETRKAQLSKQYNCDQSGVCKGDQSQDQMKECIAMCEKRKVECLKIPDKLCKTAKTDKDRMRFCISEKNDCKADFERCHNFNCKKNTQGYKAF